MRWMHLPGARRCKVQASWAKPAWPARNHLAWWGWGWCVFKPSLPLRKRNKKAAFSLLQVRITTSVTSELDLRRPIPFKETQPPLFGVGSGTDPTAGWPRKVHPSSLGQRYRSKSEQSREKDGFSCFQCHHGLKSQHPRLCLYAWCRCKQGGGN